MALGDSVTEGVGDPVPGGGLRGWADRLAAGLRALEGDLFYANLAQRGRTTRQIRDHQLEPALAHRPDLASAITGMNDVFPRTFDADGTAELLDEMVSALIGAGATVLVATLPDVTRVFPVPSRMLTSLRSRLNAMNVAIRAVAAKHEGDMVLVDAAEYPDELTRRNWSIDMLHPNSRGHLTIARAFADRLSERAGVEIELPEPLPVRLLGRESARYARWMVRESVVPRARDFASRALRRPRRG